MREGGRRGTFADHQQSLAGSGYYWDYPSETGIGAVRVGPGGLRVLDSAVVSSRLGGQVHIEIVTPHESAASRRAPEAERAMGSGVWRFGPCELDLEGRELRKHGRRVRIAPQAFYTLTLLVQRAGKLVTR
ncbi:MAG: winged helix-turn-helix domain-containing protein, partial [Terriglobia bacterium]